MILGVAARLAETRMVLIDRRGEVLGQWDRLEPVPWENVTLSVAYTRERQKDLEQWLSAVPEEVIVYHTPWPDAALAGAFAGKPGVLLTTEHWTMYAGCACENGPEAICQALGMAREPNHRTLVMANGEGGLEWLSREALKLLEQVDGPSQLRLQHSLGPHRGERAPIEPMRERALSVRRAVQDLADYPGPDPSSLALLAKTARRLSDLLRRLTSRVRLPNPTRAAWLDGELKGPLWDAMQVEFQKYLPELRWTEPDGGPEFGCAWLVLGALKEEERRAMNPNAPARTDEPGRLRKLDADAWRQLSRLRW